MSIALPGSLVISNMALGDETFDSDVGSWNVTRAKRDCANGKYEIHTFGTAETLANNDKVDVDETRVATMVADRARLEKSPPLIFIQENGLIWLVDGHHRLRALSRLGVPEFAAFVIEEPDSKPYRVYFNGERVSPLRRKE